MDSKKLGKLIKKEREEWGMSRRRLAHLVDVDIEDIKEIECGKNENPDFFLLLTICEILDISLYSLLEKCKIEIL